MTATIARTPPRCDVGLYAGDGFTVTLTVHTAAGDAFPLDAGAVAAEIRVGRADTDPVAAWAVDATAAADGVLVLSLTGADTAGLCTVGAFHGAWDVQFTPAAGEPMTLLQGAVDCAKDVTRP